MALPSLQLNSFIDEIAVSEGVDPYQFHRQVMRNSPRALKVLETAADLAGWGRTPSRGPRIRNFLCRTQWLDGSLRCRGLVGEIIWKDKGSQDMVLSGRRYCCST